MTKKTANSGPERSGTSTAGVLVLAVLVLLAAISGLTDANLLGPRTATAPAPTAALATATAPQPTEVAAAPPGAVAPLAVPQGHGAHKGFWQVLFTAPVGRGQPFDAIPGIDTALAAAIASVERTLDIAAYEFNLPSLTAAVLDARARGVRVRVVTDDADGLADEDSTLPDLIAVGIPVVTDERTDLMHNKFMILDSQVVWTGSWNYTLNDTFRNNNNALVLRSQAAVGNYQAEFDEMFAAGAFGPRSPANTPSTHFTQDGVPISVFFAPEDDVVEAIVDALEAAQDRIRFMAFSFTLDPVGQALLRRAVDGVTVEGIFETTGSETRFSELTPLHCAGLDARQDGNPYILHHKVFIVDDDVVVTGSFNFSASATESNDENLVIIRDPDRAAQYIREFERRWAEAVNPEGLICA